MDISSIVALAKTTEREQRRTEGTSSGAARGDEIGRAHV